MKENQSGQKVTRAGIVLGIGFSAWFDGFMLHMILQWHHMLSNVIPPDSMENMHRLMTADGVFDASSFLVVLTGVFLLWRAAYNHSPIPSLRTFIGQLVFGFGLFNLVEGVIDHHILAIHYVRQVPDYAVYNWTFLAVAGALPILLGWVLMRPGKRAPSSS
jgi:uncharacterized membrane protein